MHRVPLALPVSSSGIRRIIDGMFYQSPERTAHSASCATGFASVSIELSSEVDGLFYQSSERTGGAKALCATGFASVFFGHPSNC
jgi:hypothetical protein